jgi:hypothetical protein
MAYLDSIQLVFYVNELSILIIAQIPRNSSISSHRGKSPDLTTPIPGNISPREATTYPMYLAAASIIKTNFLIRQSYNLFSISNFEIPASEQMLNIRRLVK